MSNGSDASPAVHNNCNCDEFRGVIDDLTVENRKLKRRLKMYGRTRPSHPRVDRLLELTDYGLSAQQKGELEEMLRRFAINCATTLEPDAAHRDQLQQPEKVPCHISSSTSTSYSRPIDSAYASMPASGQTSTVQSANTKPNLWRSEQPVKSKHDDIQSYLHDIPQEVQSNDSSSMSESAKKKLVVIRLEALFTGRGATNNEHSQPVQQQEVSHLAAIADRKGAAGRGHRLDREGVREARILPAGAESTTDLTSGEQALNIYKSCSNHDLDCRSVTPGGLSSSSTGAPDQRPTRPLDLDLQRAQIAAENVEYMRHLGLSSPRSSLGLTPQEPDGWVYLNLLTNMAQLHTLNVTIEFIRKAVSDVSAKLELSNDGRKTRWLGGTEGTQINNDSESCLGKYPRSVADETDKTRTTPNKRRKLSPFESSGSTVPMINSVLERRSHSAQKQGSSSLLNYKPLFFHGTQSSEDDDSDSPNSDTSSSFEVEGQLLNNQSFIPGFVSHEGTSRSQERSQHYGPMILYKNANFFTDLSGYTPHIIDDPVRESPQTYYRSELASERTAGEGHYWPSEDITSNLECSQAYTERSDYVYKEPSGALIDFKPLSSVGDEISSSCSIANFEASGIGGVQPKDNFAVNVQVRYLTVSRDSSSPMPYLSAPRIPALTRLRSQSTKCHKSGSGCYTFSRLQRALHRKSDENEVSQLPHSLWIPEEDVKYEIVSTTRIELPPSQLPPPSYVFFPATSSENGSSLTSNDGTSSSADSRSDTSQSNRKLAIGFRKSPSSDGGAAESDSDTSMDLLAAARAFDPEAIAAYEREFDGNMGSIGPEEAYVASSGATVDAESRFPDDESSSPTDVDSASGP